MAALAGGWLGDYLLPRMKSSYYLVSAVSMALGVPVMIVALFAKGRAMVPAIAVAAFFLLLNTSPLNAAVINSVGAHIRATAIAVNIFIIHILGDVPSPTMMGWVADRHSLQTAFILPVIAMGISAAILFYGMRFAPPLRIEEEIVGIATSLRSIFLNRMHWQTIALDCRRHPRAGLVFAHRGSGIWYATCRRYRSARMGPQARDSERRAQSQHHRSSAQRGRTYPRDARAPARA